VARSVTFDKYAWLIPIGIPILGLAAAILLPILRPPPLPIQDHPTQPATGASPAGAQSAPTTQPTVTIDASVKHQTILGWGVMAPGSRIPSPESPVSEGRRSPSVNRTSE